MKILDLLRFCVVKEKERTSVPIDLDGAQDFEGVNHVRNAGLDLSNSAWNATALAAVAFTSGSTRRCHDIDRLVENGTGGALKLLVGDDCGLAANRKDRGLIDIACIDFRAELAYISFKKIQSRGKRFKLSGQAILQGGLH